MCEANAYVKDGGNEELFLEAVDKIIPEGDMLVLESIFGQKKMIRGKIVRMALLEHRVVIEKM